MKKNPELNMHHELPDQERSEKTPTITLHFFRHGEPYKDPNKTDLEYELSATGREQARKKFSATDSTRNIDQSVAFGSPRKRSLHAAAFAMVGETLDSITGEESLDELKEKIDKDRIVGSKVAVDPRLGFRMNKQTPFGARAYEAAVSKKKYLTFLVNESDNLAKQEHDTTGATYSRLASNIADIIKKYTIITDRWDALVKSGTYKNENLERFFGTHGGVADSFLLKIVEKFKGTAERDRLVDLIPDQSDFMEGFDVTITGRDQERRLHITYHKVNDENPDEHFVFDEDIPLSVLDDIIAEGHSTESFS